MGAHQACDPQPVDVVVHGKQNTHQHHAPDDQQNRSLKSHVVLPFYTRRFDDRLEVYTTEYQEPLIGSVHGDADRLVV